MKRICIISFLALSITSCGATNPKIEYANTIKHHGNNAAISISDAILKVRANTLIKGNALPFSLEQTDPVIKMHDLSYYKLFQFKNNGNQSCNITVKSFVKGMSPWYSILPIVAIVSPSKKVNTAPPRSLEGKIPNFGPYRLTGNWVDKCSEKGIYYVLVTADTRALNKPIDRQTMNLYVADANSTFNFQYTFLGHFTGDLEILIE